MKDRKMALIAQPLYENRTGAYLALYGNKLKHSC
jgi:hypothetical protein